MTGTPDCPRCEGPRRRTRAGRLYCSPCAVKRVTAHVRAIRRDPARAEAYREYHRLYNKNRRAVDPVFAEKGRAQNRDYKLRARTRATERENLRRAALRNEAFVEHVEPLVLLEREDGICGICEGDLDPFSFQVDHIVPLSKGGEHSYDNTQPAHPLCNQRKYDKEMV